MALSPSQVPQGQWSMQNSRRQAAGSSLVQLRLCSAVQLHHPPPLQAQCSLFTSPNLSSLHTTRRAFPKLGHSFNNKIPAVHWGWGSVVSSRPCGVHRKTSTASSLQTDMCYGRNVYTMGIRSDLQTREGFLEEATCKLRLER